MLSTEVLKLPPASWGTRSSGQMRMLKVYLAIVSRMFRWLLTTPLGCPVEPDVYMTLNRLSGPMSTSRPAAVEPSRIPGIHVQHVGLAHQASREREAGAIGDERRGLRVVEQQRQPRRRQGRVQEHVEAAGLEHPQHGDDGRAAVTEQERGRPIGRVRAGDQRARDAIGGAAELGVAQRAGARGQGDTARVPPHLRLEARGHRSLDVLGRKRRERAAGMPAPLVRLALLTERRDLEGGRPHARIIVGPGPCARLRRRRGPRCR